MADPDEILISADERMDSAVQALKRLVNACYEADLASSLELARALRHPLDHTQDMLEGVRAFEEKRAPRFEGR